MATIAPKRLAAGAVLGLAVGLCQGQTTRAQTETGSVVRVRIQDDVIRKAVEDGLRRSSTFRWLIDRVQNARVFLYIMRVPDLPEKMDGCVALDTGGAGEDRYIRMMIRSGLRRDRTIAVIGHEAQHVLEILDTPRGNAKDPSDRSWATQISTHWYDTKAARDVEHEIAAELRKRDKGRVSPVRFQWNDGAHRRIPRDGPIMR